MTIQNLDTFAESILGMAVEQDSAIRRIKIANNVNAVVRQTLVVDALKQIEANVKKRYDTVGKAIAQRVSEIQDGRNGADGANGKDGQDGKDGLPGPAGVAGRDGVDGRNGEDGQDGISVTDARLDFDGSLVITLSTGKEINVGDVVPEELAKTIHVISGGGSFQKIITSGTAAPSGGVNGDIYLQYA